MKGLSRIRWFFLGGVLFFFALGCTGSKGGSIGQKKQADPLKKLEEEMEGAGASESLLAKLRGALYRAASSRDRNKIQEWIDQIEKKLERNRKKRFEAYWAKVKELLQSGKTEEAIVQLENPPPSLREPPYLEKIIAKLYELKSSYGVYQFGLGLIKKAKKMAKYKKYKRALAILKAYNLVQVDKPQDLTEKIERAKEEIKREYDRRKAELARLAKLPWYRCLNKEDLYNWDYRPAGEEFWTIKNYLLVGKGSGSGANSSYIVLSTIPKDRQGLDNYEAEDQSDYILEGEFKFLEGQGMDLWVRVVKADNKMTPIPLAAPAFKKGIWYKIRVEVRGSKALLFCSNNLYEKEVFTTSQVGTIGFRLYETTKMQMRNLRIKLLK